jgi:uncharacterized cupredoxin-like copper-binding protein
MGKAAWTRIAATALLAVVVACGSPQNQQSRQSTEGNTEQARDYFAAEAQAAAQSRVEVEVRLRDGAIELPASLPAGATTFVVSNDGPGEHGFAIEGRGVERELESPLAPGASGRLEMDLEAGTYFVSDPADGRHTAGANRRLQVVDGA